MAIARAAILLLTLGLWSLGTRAGEVTLTLASAWSQRQNFTAEPMFTSRATRRPARNRVSRGSSA